MSTSWLDFKNVGNRTGFEFAVIPPFNFNGISLSAIAHFAMGTNTKYLSWHIPKNNFYLHSCKAAIDNTYYYMDKASSDIHLQWEGGSSKSLIFTKQVYILGEVVLDYEEKRKL